MRILHLDEQPGWRGGEQQASWLMQGLAAAGHQVWLAARPGSAFLGHDHGGIPVQRIPLALRGEFDLPSAWHLARLARESRIDIVHAHTSHAHSIALLSRVFWPHPKVVVHRRVSFPPRGGPLNRWKYRAPDRIVCVSAGVRDVLLAFGLPEQRLALVHSAVDLARLDVAPLPRTALGVPEGVPFLLSAGALVGHKDHATLLDAFAQVRNAHPHARLAIAGEGPLRAQLEARAQALGVAQSVQLLGQRHDVPALIRAADVYVSSSWSEGLGTSVLEALGAGTPVVATEAGGVGEMVLPGQTGRLVPSREPAALAGAVLACLAEPEISQRLAAAGQDWVRARFGVERMVAGNLEVYRSLFS